MKALVKLFKAVADQNRLSILKMLEDQELCVCEIQAALQLAQPTVSKHLRVLEDAGLVDRRKEGLWVNYRWSAKPSAQGGEILAGLRGWLNDDPEIRRLKHLLPDLHRLKLGASERP